MPLECPAPSNITMTGVITIDKADDPGGLLCTARYWYTKQQNSLDHTTRLQALTNCLKSSALSMNIVGWGTPGVIHTGSADRPPNDDQYIGCDNLDVWKGEIEDLGLKKGMSLTLCSCDTGIGKAGACFLHALATIIKGEVRAPTGQVYFDKTCKVMSLHEEAVWQIATENHRPDPIEPLRLYDSTSDKDFILISYLEGLTAIRMRDVTDVRYFDSLDAVKPRAEWSGEHVIPPLAFFCMERPVLRNAIPLSFRTGALTIRFRRGGPPEERVFFILNNRLLQDATFPHTFYYANVDELLAFLPAPV